MKEIFGLRGKRSFNKRTKYRQKKNAAHKAVKNTEREEDYLYEYDAEPTAGTYEYDNSDFDSYDLEDVGDFYEDESEYDESYGEEDEEFYDESYEEEDEEFYDESYGEEDEEFYDESYEEEDEEFYDESYGEEDEEFYDESYEEEDEEFYDESYEEEDEEFYDESYGEEDGGFYDDEYEEEAYVESLSFAASQQENDYDESAYEEYDAEAYAENEEDLSEAYEESQDTEYIPPVVYEDDGMWEDKEPLPYRIGNKIMQLVGKMGTMDLILAATAVVIVILGGITFTSYAVSKNMHKQAQALAPVGAELSNMGIVGESGLLALADNVLAASNAQEVTTEEEETTQEAEETSDDVKVSFTSVERDLKIKFVYGATGNLVTGVTFEVELTNAKGKTTTLRDEDQDGVIYQKDLTAGKYDVLIKSVGDFRFPEQAQKVTVKDKIEYVAINVQNEIKTEAQVNAATEDTGQTNALAEAESTPAVKDTVEWVESTKTPKNGSEEYSKISKDKITDPSTITRRQNIMKLAGIDVSLDKSEETVLVGNTVTLRGSTYSDTASDTEKITYQYEWTSSDTNVASVSDGVVTGKKAGNATITYKIVKKITKTDTNSVEKTKEISVEEYRKLSSEEQKKCKEITEQVTEEYQTEEVTTDEEGNETTTQKTETKTHEEVVGYQYTYTESNSNTTESTEEGSATCKITVKDVSVSSAALTLDKAEVSVNEKETVTVTPAKLEYKYTNGKTDSKTSGFPAINWQSSDKAIATVDDKGVVSGLKAGTATITASIAGIKDEAGKEISVSATCKVTVNAVNALTITLDKEKASVAVGKTVTLKPTVQHYATDAGVTWSSSDEKIAKVDDKGVVTGIKVGSVTITATTKEKSNATKEKVSAACTITVTSDVTKDDKTLLKDNDGNQVYIKDSEGKYREAVYADYYTAEKFYIKNTIEYTYTGWQTIDDKTYFFDKNGNYVTGTQIIQGIEYNFTSDGVLKMNHGGGSLGIDVSKWNGSINWTAVKNSGIDFAIIRCGYRGSSTGALIEDPTFKKNIQAAKAAGIKVGIYFFTQAVNEVEAVEEASMAISLAKNYGLTYPIFIDTESSGGRADGISRDTRTAVVNAFCKTVSNAGYKAGIYASKSWFETKLHTSTLNAYKIWLAQYSGKPTYSGRYDMWQYSSKGTVGGISGKVDMNISYLGY